MHRVLVLMLASVCCLAQPQPHKRPKPDHADVVYGAHDRNVLDFWRSESRTPTPLAVYIHGGGFRRGSKNGLGVDVLKALLGAGISVAAINYRLVQENPLPAAHDDARRALQFLRATADNWNIDKNQVAAFGSSAGAQLCMYLAFHDEMSELGSADPVERESTRLTYVASSNGQTTMDFNWWFKHIPGYDKPHRPVSEYFGEIPKDRLNTVIHDVSALSIVTSDDPPIYMSYRMAPLDATPSDPRRVEGWMVHHVNFGVALKKKMNELGVEANLNYPGADCPYSSAQEFFIAKFGR